MLVVSRYQAGAGCPAPPGWPGQLGLVSVSTDFAACYGYGVDQYQLTNTSASWRSTKAGGLRTASTAYIQRVPKGVVPSYDVSFGIPQYTAVLDPGTPYGTVTAHIGWTTVSDAGAGNGSESSRAIQNNYLLLGGEGGPLGARLTAEASTPDGRARYVNYEHGGIYWRPGVGALAVYGDIYKKWAELNYEKGPLG